jgi:hypothetical protein
MLNKMSGEVNRIDDDGRNYLMHMWVVPPEELTDVVAALAPDEDFTRQDP